MKVLTVINDHHNPGYNLLRLSCMLNRLELVVLVSDKQDFNTKRLKDDLLKRYLYSEVQDNEIIFFTDGYDTLFMTSEDEILEKYYRVNADLLFSCESGCWPDTSLAKLYPDAPETPYGFLNSGGFIGRAGLIKALLDEEVDEPEKFAVSNQYIWTKKYFRHTDKIVLDTGCDIFQTFSPEMGKKNYPGNKPYDYDTYARVMKQWFESNFLISNNRLFSKITGTWPCHAHFNGNSKCLVDYDIVNMLFEMIPGYSSPVYYNKSA